MSQTCRIGLISDTHGLIRPDVFRAFDGVDMIYHAGDVGSREVLCVLATIAPVQGVLGNTDAPGDPGLSTHLAETVGGLVIHLSHGHEVGIPSPERLLARYEADVIVFGHTHRPLIVRAGARLVVNPGAAGPRRFGIPASVARLTISGGRAEARIIELLDEPR